MYLLVHQQFNCKHYIMQFAETGPEWIFYDIISQMCIFQGTLDTPITDRV